jgi:hypothetical protein
MLDARPGFIVKFLKRSLIVNLLKHELSTASLQSSTGKVILNHVDEVFSIIKKHAITNFHNLLNRLLLELHR